MARGPNHAHLKQCSPFKQLKQLKQQQHQDSKQVHIAALKNKQGRKHRRGAGQKKRRAALRQQRKALKLQQLADQVPQSPVCPPAPLNTNEYLMERCEQHAAALLPEPAAASVSAYSDSGDSYPVCPPAPYLDNEYFMSRFEQDQQQQEAASGAAAAAAAPPTPRAVAIPPVVQAGVAEWDPLLQEVTRLSDSTAPSYPATAACADDCCSQS